MKRNGKIVLLIIFNLIFLTNCLRSADLVGYFHNWNDVNAPYIQLDNIDSKYSYIIVSFAVPTSNTDMTMSFVPDGVQQSVFISKIQSLKSNGKKVLLSIGGATSNIDLSNSQQRDNFVNSLNSIINTYGFDGLDVDLESGNSILITSGSTIANPTNTSMINLIDAIKQLMNNYRNSYNKKMILTMAPETAYVQGGQSGFGSIWGGYLPIIHALRDSIDVLQVQLYNSGTMYGLDGNIYSQGTSDFIVAMTEASIRGFNTAGGFFNGLGESKVAVGLPACSSVAGGGFVDTNTVRSAMNYLLGIGSKPGSYTLINSSGYPNLRGMMTWSINWDAVANCGGRYSFANNYSKIFTQIPTFKLKVNSGLGSGNYKQDTSIRIIANQPLKGYKFLQWSGSTSFVDDIYNDTALVTMPNKDIELTATYEKITYNLTIENGNGSGDYYAETILKINATTPFRQKFTHWSGNTEILISDNRDTALIMIPYSNAKLTANFESIKYRLSIINGKGSGDYPPDTLIKIIADTAPKGYKFYSWSGDTNLVENPLNDTIIIKMPERDISLKAEYKLLKYKLIVNKGFNTGEYEQGEKVLVFAELPQKGYSFEKWVGDVINLEDTSKDSTILTMPEKDIVITAQFIEDKIDSAKLTVKNGFGSGLYPIGSKIKIYFVKTNDDQYFLKWIGDTAYIENINKDTTLVTIPNKSITLEAEYKIISDVSEDISINSISKILEGCRDSEIFIIDLLGRIHAKYEPSNHISLENLSKGIYLIRICNKYYKFLKE